MFSLEEVLENLKRIKKVAAKVNERPDISSKKSSREVKVFCEKVIKHKNKSGFDIRYVGRDTYTGNKHDFKLLLDGLEKERKKVGSLPKRIQVVARIEDSIHYAAFDFLIEDSGIKACVIDSISMSGLPYYFCLLEQCNIPYCCSFTQFLASEHGCYIFALSFAFCMAKIKNLHPLFVSASKKTDVKYINKIKKGITLKYRGEYKLTKLILVHPICLHPQLVKNAQSLTFLKNYIEYHKKAKIFSSEELKKLEEYVKDHKKDVRSLDFSKVEERNTALFWHKYLKYSKRIEPR